MIVISYCFQWSGKILIVYNFVQFCTGRVFILHYLPITNPYVHETASGQSGVHILVGST